MFLTWQKYNFSFIACLPMSSCTAICSAVFCNHLQQITHTQGAKGCQVQIWTLLQVSSWNDSQQHIPVTLSSSLEVMYHVNLSRQKFRYSREMCKLLYLSPLCWDGHVIDILCDHVTTQTSANLSLVQSDGLLDHCLSCMLPVLWIRLKRQHLDWFNGWQAHVNDLNDYQTERVWGLILYYAPHESSVLL